MFLKLLLKNLESYSIDFSKYKKIFINLIFCYLIFYFINYFIPVKFNNEFNIQFKNGVWNFNNEAFLEVSLKNKKIENSTWKSNYNLNFYNDCENFILFQNLNIQDKELNINLNNNSENIVCLSFEADEIYFYNNSHISNEIKNNFKWFGFRKKNTIVLLKNFETVYKFDNKYYCLVKFNNNLKISIFYSDFNLLNLNDSRFEKIEKIIDSSLISKTLYKIYLYYKNYLNSSLYGLLISILFFLLFIGYLIFKILQNLLLKYQIEKMTSSYMLELAKATKDELYKKNNILFTLDLDNIFIFIIPSFFKPILMEIFLLDNFYIKYNYYVYAFFACLLVIYNYIIQRNYNLFSAFLTIFISFYWLGYFYNIFVASFIYSLLIIIVSIWRFIIGIKINE